MRFVITGEWTRNRLLQTIVALYAIYVAGLWLTNALLYFSKMSLSYASVVAYYLGSEESFQAMCAELAAMFEEHQKEFPDVPMGSYPFFRDNKPGANLVLRSTDPARLAAAEAGLRAKIAARGWS